MANIEEKFKNIKLLIFDLQGVLISNQPGSLSDELTQFYETMKDFCDFATNNNLIVAIITGLTDEQLHKNICTKCSCNTLSSSMDKVSQADKLIEQYGITYKNIFYIGDDLFDIPLLKKAGLSAAPVSARREVKRIVDFICPGNNGMERLKFIEDSILKNKNSAA